MVGFRRFSLIVFLVSVLLQSSANAFECQKLFDFIKKNKPESIDLLLKKMSENTEFKRFLGHYTLVHKSKSLQNATHLEPRVIVYGEDAKTIMTFINRADVHDRDVIELSCWSDSASAFEFLEIDFSNGLPPIDRLVSKPTSCLECHGQDPRPNFEAYNTWSGMFGSLSRLGCSYINKKSKEYIYYNEYLKMSRNSGRYKYLPDTTEFTDHTTSGYGLASCVTHKLVQDRGADDAQYETVVEPSSIQFQNAFSKEPNAQLLDLLTPLNSKRIARMILSQQYSEAFRYAMHGVGLSCDLNDGFIPDGLQTRGSSFFTLESDTIETVGAEYLSRERQFLEFNLADQDDPISRAPINFGLKYIKTISQLRYVFERMGLSFNRLTMGFDSGSFDFSTNNATTTSIVSDIINFAYAIDTSTSDNQPTCEWLAVQSHKALSALKLNLDVKKSVAHIDREPLLLSEKNKAEDILKSKCFSCHSINQIAIPFDSPQKLKDRILGINLKGKPQMPLGQPLDIVDQMLMIRYIDDLNKSFE